MSNTQLPPLYLHADDIGPDKPWRDVTTPVMRSIYDRSLDDVDPEILAVMQSEMHR